MIFEYRSENYLLYRIELFGEYFLITETSAQTSAEIGDCLTSAHVNYLLEKTHLPDSKYKLVRIS